MEGSEIRKTSRPHKPKLMFSEDFGTTPGPANNKKITPPKIPVARNGSRNVYWKPTSDLETGSEPECSQNREEENTDFTTDITDSGPTVKELLTQMMRDEKAASDIARIVKEQADAREMSRMPSLVAEKPKFDASAPSTSIFSRVTTPTPPKPYYQPIAPRLPVATGIYEVKMKAADGNGPGTIYLEPFPPPSSSTASNPSNSLVHALPRFLQKQIKANTKFAPIKPNEGILNTPQARNFPTNGVFSQPQPRFAQPGGIGIANPGYVGHATQQGRKTAAKMMAVKRKVDISGNGSSVVEPHRKMPASMIERQKEPQFMGVPEALNVPFYKEDRLSEQNPNMAETLARIFGYPNPVEAPSSGGLPKKLKRVGLDELKARKMERDLAKKTETDEVDPNAIVAEWTRQMFGPTSRLTATPPEISMEMIPVLHEGSNLIVRCEIKCHLCNWPMRLCMRKTSYKGLPREYLAYRCLRKGCQTFRSLRKTINSKGDPINWADEVSAKLKQKTAKKGATIEQSDGLYPHPSTSNFQIPVLDGVLEQTVKVKLEEPDEIEERPWEGPNILDELLNAHLEVDNQVLAKNGPEDDQEQLLNPEAFTTTDCELEHVKTLDQLRAEYGNELLFSDRLLREGYLRKRQYCEKCGTGMSLRRRREGIIWRCRKGQVECSSKSARFGSWFSNSKLKMDKIFLIIFMHVWRYTNEQMKKEICLSGHTVTDFRQTIRELSGRIAKRYGPIGGPGLKVQLDEHALHLKKSVAEGEERGYNWVLGGIDETGRIFVVRIGERSENCVMEMVRKHVHPESIVITDGWNGYATLKDFVRTHETVRNMGEFKKIRGFEDNCLEGMWDRLKVRLHVIAGTSVEILPNYIADFVVMENEKSNYLKAILYEIKKVVE